jgi:NADH-ubiquinone oxidoreductase chain 5
MMIGLGTNFWAISFFILPKNEIIAESKFVTPTIIKLIPILFNTLGAFVAYNINFVANQFIFIHVYNNDCMCIDVNIMI